MGEMKLSVLAILGCAAVWLALAGVVRAGGGASGGATSRVELKGAVASVAADRARIRVDERLGVTITLETAVGDDGSLPPIGERLGAWRVVAVTPRETRRSTAGGMTRGAALVLEPFLAGEYEIPALAFTVRSEGGEERVLTTGVVNVLVESVVDGPEASQKIADARGVIDSVAAGGRTAWVIAIAGGVLVLAAGGGMVLVRRMRRDPEPLPPGWRVARLELERALAGMEWTGDDAARALEASARTLAGWRRVVAAVSDGGPGAVADLLDREIEVLRFSGQSAEARTVRRIGEEVMRLTGTVPVVARGDDEPSGEGGES